MKIAKIKEATLLIKIQEELSDAKTNLISSIANSNYSLETRTIIEGLLKEAFDKAINNNLKKITKL